jgi:hypothetical protein
MTADCGGTPAARAEIPRKIMQPLRNFPARVVAAARCDGKTMQRVEGPA